MADIASERSPFLNIFEFFKQIPAQPRDAKMIHSIASLIRAKSKLLLFENPDTVEIYKVGKILNSMLI